MDDEIIENQETTPIAEEEVTDKPKEESKPETPVEEPTQKIRRKVKIDDEELEIDEDELISGYQKAKASTKRFQEAARLKKEAEELASKLQENPFEALKGKMDPKQLRDLTEKWLISQLEDEQLSPEEKELRDLRKQKEEWERQQEEVKKKAEEEQLSVKTQQQIERYNKEFVAAMEKHSIPKSYAAIKRMAYLVKEAAEQGYDMDTETAAEIVNEELTGEFTQLIKTLDGEQLVKFLGKEVTDKIRKYDVSRLKNQTSQKPKEGSTSKVSKSEKQYVGTKGWLELQEKIRQGI